ncbi:MAG: CGNR zinc finger domain-containing protein [Pseudolysinimonas sp.]
MTARESELLALLNSAPVHHGEIVETLDNPRLIRLRNDLQSVIRGDAPATTMSRYLRGVSRQPRILNDGISWTLAGPASELPAAELVIEWARVERELPGRLRPCANEECNKFLIDHSKPNTARWCSMAGCGNRMKARRHQARQNASTR